MRIELHPAAETDVASAAAFYSREGSPALAARFVGEFERVTRLFMVPTMINRIVNHPEIGGGRFEGYTSEEATEKKILRNVFTEGDAYWSSGDLLRYDEDGYFYIVDRKKDMIIASGFKVLPRDVEEVLFMHPQVLEAVVVGIRHPTRGDDTVKAYVVPKEGQQPSADEIKQFCKQHLAPYKVPRDIEFRTELPKTMVGKVLRRVLVEEEKQKQAAKSAPKSPEQPTPA